MLRIYHSSNIAVNRIPHGLGEDFEKQDKFLDDTNQEKSSMDSFSILLKLIDPSYGTVKVQKMLIEFLI